MSKVFAIFLGTSPNALAAAARLGRAGRPTLVLETRDTLGGPTATEAFAPGFRAESGVMSGMLTSGATRIATAPASTIRMRAGTDGAPNAGATMKQEPMRTKGQKSSASQAFSCVEVRVSMGGPRGLS